MPVAAVTEGTAGVARAPDISVDIAAHAVGAAFDAVDDAVGDQFLVGQLVVHADIEHVDHALAAGTGVAGPLAGADDIELLIRPSGQPVASRRRQRSLLGLAEPGKRARASVNLRCSHLKNSDDGQSAF